MNERTNVCEYIYLLHEREFISKKLNIYKIGRTGLPLLTRFNQYPKGSKLLYQRDCNNSKKIELEIINFFKNKYIHITDIGNEYFKGNYNEMIDDINIIIKKAGELKCTNRYIIDQLINSYFKDISDDEKQIFIFILENEKLTENNIIELIYIKYNNEICFINNKWTPKNNLENIDIDYDNLIKLIQGPFCNILIKYMQILNKKMLELNRNEYKKMMDVSCLINNYALKLISTNYSSIKIKHKLEKKFIKIS